MAEKLVNEFTVNRPIEEAWPVICNVELIAPCMPGAQLEEIEGDVYRGVVKIKLGAVSTQFKGQAQFAERDDENHRAKLRAEGRDTGGRGNAAADITAEATSLSPTSTKCTVTTDLHITGKVAQFGRGIMGDVSKKLMEQFAANLNTMLDETALDKSSDSSSASADIPTGHTASDSTSTTGTATNAESASDGSATAPTKRVISGPATEPIDVAGMAGPALLKRLGPVVLGLLIVFLLLRRRR
ncbi:MAG TPA: SRPBCC family protein [Ilumatobacteraceae bacterium]|nr:SRPBCC family protein [Ilumatobacteraceae bacterium]